MIRKKGIFNKHARAHSSSSPPRLNRSFPSLRLSIFRRHLRVLAGGAGQFHARLRRREHRRAGRLLLLVAFALLAAASAFLVFALVLALRLQEVLDAIWVLC